MCAATRTQDMCPSTLVFVVKELDPERWVDNGSTHFTVILKEKDATEAPVISVDILGGSGSSSVGSDDSTDLGSRLASLEASLAAERQALALSESRRLASLRDCEAAIAKAEFQKALALELERQVYQPSFHA